MAKRTAAFEYAWTYAAANPVVAVVVTVVAVAALAAVSTVLKPSSATRGSKTTLIKDTFIPLTLEKKIVVSHDTRVFRFALPSKEHVLGLPIGQHVVVQGTVDGATVQRSYTPISSDDDKGFVDLMVKVYRPNERFPKGGVMSQLMEGLVEGRDALRFRGPTGRFEYKGKGVVQHKEERRVRHLGMIGGGTGITPLLQVVRAILKDPSDPTTVSLVFANQTEEDILLRPELEECAKDPRFKLWYTLDRPPATGWSYSQGFISESMLAEHMPKAAPDALVLMCGPPPMISSCKAKLQALGTDAANFVVF